MRTFAVVSLGCAKNLVDTEIMLGQLTSAGWKLINDFSKAEVILINTCGFIETAKSESIQQILELAEYKKIGRGICKQLIVAGCLVQRYLAELKSEIPEVDLWLGLADIGRILELVDKKTDPLTELEQAAPPFLNNHNLPRFQATLSHTSYIKIAEGCNHKCSYCAIPLIKGEFHSRHLNSIIKETQTLVENGVQEINLIAQDITRYGYDLEPKVSLQVLLERMIIDAKPAWIRLLYAYPMGVNKALLDLMAKESSICRYLDLPIQHINSRILKKMGRPETPELIKEKIALIRDLVPGITLRTTFIVGFPSETEREFEELLQFVTEGNFEHIGVFSYSREEGTAAYSMEPQIDEEVKEDRKRRILMVQQEASKRLLARQIHKQQTILIDKVLDNNIAVGRTQNLAPDVDGVVYVQNYQGPAGRFIQGVIIGNDEYNLIAQEILPTSTGIL
jgi:ribosomal protein S12 methylthiotransferase